MELLKVISTLASGLEQKTPADEVSIDKTVSITATQCTSKYLNEGVVFSPEKPATKLTWLNKGPTNLTHHNKVIATLDDRVLVNCFDPNNSTVPSCELSAAVYLKNFFLVRNDKDPKDIELFGNAKNSHLDPAQHLKRTPKSVQQKPESASISPDGKLLVIVGPLDRKDPDFNRVLFGDPKEVAMNGQMKDLEKEGAPGQKPLRQMIIDYMIDRKLMKGTFPGDTHFKIEATAILPNGKIMFGIRETAEKFEPGKTDYKTLFIVADYSHENGKLQISGISSHIDLTENIQAQLGGKKVGVGSAEYSPTDKRIYFTTTYENGETLETYFWHMTQDEDGKYVTAPIYDPTGAPMKVNHKVEGLAIRTKKDEKGVEQVVLVGTCDDDKNLKPSAEDPERKINQAYIFEWTVSNGKQGDPNIFCQRSK